MLQSSTLASGGGSGSGGGGGICPYCSNWRRWTCLCRFRDGTGDAICSGCKRKVKNCICQPPRYISYKRSAGYTTYKEVTRTTSNNKKLLF